MTDIQSNLDYARYQLEGAMGEVKVLIAESNNEKTQRILKTFLHAMEYFDYAAIAATGRERLYAKLCGEMDAMRGSLLSMQQDISALRDSKPQDKPALAANPQTGS